MKQYEVHFPNGGCLTVVTQVINILSERVNACKWTYWRASAVAINGIILTVSVTTLTTTINRIIREVARSKAILSAVGGSREHRITVALIINRKVPIEPRVLINYTRSVRRGGGRASEWDVFQRSDRRGRSFDKLISAVLVNGWRFEGTAPRRVS